MSRALEKSSLEPATPPVTPAETTQIGRITPKTDRGRSSERVQLVRPNVILHAEEIDELVRLYQAGATIDGLARQFGIYRATARDHLVRRGVELRYVNAALSAEQLTQATKLYEGGATLRQLSILLGVAPNTVRAQLAELGVTIRTSPVGTKRL